jgi:hypothetical protein
MSAASEAEHADDGVNGRTTAEAEPGRRRAPGRDRPRRDE